MDGVAVVAVVVPGAACERGDGGSEELRVCKKCLGMAGTGVGSVREIRLDRRRSAARSSLLSSCCPRVRLRTRGIGCCCKEEEEAGDAALSHDASVLERWRSTRGASGKRVAMLACGQGGVVSQQIRVTADWTDSYQGESSALVVAIVNE